MHPRGRIKRMVQNTVPTRNEAWRQYRTCDRKKVYPDEEAAWRAVRSIIANGNDLYPDFDLRPYRCDFCALIHVGHSNTPRVTEQRIRPRIKALPQRASHSTILASIER